MTKGKKFAARVSVLGAALVATAGLGTVAAAPASAHYSQCPENRFCIWEHSSYEGMFASYGGSNSNIGSTMNDRMTSYWNRTDQWVSVYDHSNYGACMLVIPPGGSDPAVSSQFNDKMTSLRFGQC